MKTNNKGFAAIEIVLIVVIVLIVGVVGYKVWQTRQSNKAATSTQQTEQVAQEPTNAPEIKKTSDLDTASSDVDKLDAQNSVNEIDKLGQEVSSL